MKRLFNFLFLFLAIAVALPALAQTSSVTEPDTAQLSGWLVTAFTNKDYFLLGAGLLLGLAYLARKVGAKFVPWFATPRGGAVITFAVAFLTPVVTALANGIAASPGLFLSALALAFGASGLWSTPKNVVKKALEPSDPPNMQPVCTPADAANGKPWCT